jgi:hypothetical protein
MLIVGMLTVVFLAPLYNITKIDNAKINRRCKQQLDDLQINAKIRANGIK